jgi:hypothetical protein
MIALRVTVFYEKEWGLWQRAHRRAGPCLLKIYGDGFAA